MWGGRGFFSAIVPKVYCLCLSVCYFGVLPHSARGFGAEVSVKLIQWQKVDKNNKVMLKECPLLTQTFLCCLRSISIYLSFHPSFCIYICFKCMNLFINLFWWDFRDHGGNLAKIPAENQKLAQVHLSPGSPSQCCPQVANRWHYNTQKRHKQPNMSQKHVFQAQILNMLKQMVKKRKKKDENKVLQHKSQTSKGLYDHDSVFMLVNVS